MMKHVDYDESVCWLIEFENCWMKRNPTLFCRPAVSKALGDAFGSTQPTRTNKRIDDLMADMREIPSEFKQLRSRVSKDRRKVIAFSKPLQSTFGCWTFNNDGKTVSSLFGN